MNQLSFAKRSLEEATRLLAGPYKLQLIDILLSGAKRYNQLRRLIPEISQRHLTQDLRMLEKAGFVRRIEYPVIPFKVEYELTKDAELLKHIIISMTAAGQWMLERQ